jgi:ribosome-binding protein aMBF1 (putative translation factor)
MEAQQDEIASPLRQQRRSGGNADSRGEESFDRGDTASSSSGRATDVELVPTSGPIGATLEAEYADAIADDDDRVEHERLAAFEKLARLVIMRRAQLGISQADLARRMETSASVVSRIESGHHPTNTATLKRVAEALQGRALLGFDFAVVGEHADYKELVTL